MGNTKSKNYEPFNSSRKDAIYIDPNIIQKVNRITTDIIRNSSFNEIKDENKCEQLNMITSKIFNKYFTTVELKMLYDNHNDNELNKELNNPTKIYFYNH